MARIPFSGLLALVLAAGTGAAAPPPVFAGPSPRARVLSSAALYRLADSGKDARVIQADEIVILNARACDDLRVLGMLRTFFENPRSLRVELLRAGQDPVRLSLGDCTRVPYLSDDTFVSDAKQVLLPLPAFRDGDTLRIRVEAEWKPFLGFPLHLLGRPPVLHYPPLPVDTCTVTYDLPAKRSPRHRVWNGLGDPEVSADGDRVRWRWSAARLPEPPEEIFGPPPEDLLPVISVGVDRIAWGPASTWTELAATYGNEVRDRVKEVEGRPRAGPFPAACGRILGEVQDKLRYVNIVLGPGGYIPERSDRVLERRYGDCKGMSVALLSLLRAETGAGELALVRTRPPAGRQVDPLPTLIFFNHMIVHAAHEGRDLWLDATDEHGTVAVPRIDIQGAPVLVTAGPAAGYRRIDRIAGRTATTLRVAPGEDGQWTATGTLTSVGPRANLFLHLAEDSDPASTARVALREFDRRGFGGRHEILAAAAGGDTLRVSFTAPVPSPLETEDGRVFARPPWLLDPFPLNAFDPEERRTDLYWPFREERTDTLRIVPGNGALPASIPDTTWTGEAAGIRVRVSRTVADSALVWTRTVHILDDHLAAGDYPAARELRAAFRRLCSTRVPAGP